MQAFTLDRLKDGEVVSLFLLLWVHLMCQSCPQSCPHGAFIIVGTTICMARCIITSESKKVKG